MVAPWKKSYDKLRQHFKKPRLDFTNKDPFSQSYGFSSSHVWMWELDHKEGWAPKNWCFWTVVLEKTVEIPWTERGSNQSIINKISPEYFLNRLMLKLKLQYFGHLMQRVDSLENILMLEKIEGRRQRGRQRMRWWIASSTWWTWVWASSRSWWWSGKPSVLESIGLPRVRHNWVTEQQHHNYYAKREEKMKLYKIPN